MYDVIVVGARCAGAPTALLFARAGYRVLLLDRARFPSDTLSTLYIQQPGVALLDRWGVLDRVRATGCPALGRVVYQLDDVQVAGCAAGGPAYAPRRYLLDGILVEAAVAAGAEFRPSTAVTGLVEEAGRVVGVRLGSKVERARLVVGADGMRSAVAGFLDAATTVENDRLTCAYYTFWEGPETDFELYEGPDGWAAAVPTNGAVLISAYFPQARFEEVRTNAETAYLDCLRTNAPPLYAQIQGARRAGRLTGTGDQRNFFRQAYGPGWVLVGDAGHHKDSITARGIGDAFLQADLLAGLVGDGLADEARLDRALKAYAEERDARLLDGYKATLVIAQPEARDRRRALLRAVGSDSGLTQRYFDTVAGVRPVAELYTPDLLALLNAQG